MAKGQMRSNKEVKKPKKEKIKANAAATNPLTARLVEAQEKAKAAKK
jgi:hypothetical protein